MRHLLFLALLGATPALAAPPVTYFDAAQVRAAFERGAVLLDGSGRDYMVHASYRDRAGQGEVHTQDADVIYVLDGAATFVTGGTLTDATPTASDELRGSGIAGGETRTLAAGDVIVVPAGTPHWFKAVQRPVRYFVVKVR